MRLFNFWRKKTKPTISFKALRKNVIEVTSREARDEDWNEIWKLVNKHGFNIASDQTAQQITTDVKAYLWDRLKEVQLKGYMDGNRYTKSFGEAMNHYHSAYIEQRRKNKNQYDKGLLSAAEIIHNAKLEANDYGLEAFPKELWEILEVLEAKIRKEAKNVKQTK